MICKVPVVSTFHGFVDSSGKDRLLQAKRRLINRGSSRIVFVSDRLREHFVRKYRFSEKKSVTIYNGVDTSVFKPVKDDSLRKELGLGPETLLIGAVGNIRPAKGYEYLIKAARLVCDKRSDCKFVIAGEGSGPLYVRLLALRRSLNLLEDVVFLGFRRDAWTIFNNLDVFVLPSVSEGFSISTIEAMACGVPVVVTRSGGPEEIVQAEGDGLTAQPENERELAESLLAILDDKLLREKLAENSWRRVESKFSNASMLRHYGSLYSELIAMLKK